MEAGIDAQQDYGENENCLQHPRLPEKDESGEKRVCSAASGDLNAFGNPKCPDQKDPLVFCATQFSM